MRKVGHAAVAHARWEEGGNARWEEGGNARWVKEGTESCGARNGNVGHQGDKTENE